MSSPEVEVILWKLNDCKFCDSQSKINKKAFKDSGMRLKEKNLSDENPHNYNSAPHITLKCGDLEVSLGEGGLTDFSDEIDVDGEKMTMKEAIKRFKLACERGEL